MELELAAEGHQGAHEVGGVPRTLMSRVCPPGLRILRGFFFIFSKVFRGVLGHSENFYFLHKKQHHGSTAENNVRPG